MKVLTITRDHQLATFNEMCAAYTAFHDRTLEYFQKISLQIVAFRDGYAKAIAAPTEPYRAASGFEEYVRIMRFVNGEYEAAEGKRLFDAPDENMIAWFGMAITIERDRNTNPRRVYTERIGLKLRGDSIEVHLPDLDQVIIEPYDGTVADYSNAYEAVTQDIMGDLARDPLA